MGGGGGGEEDIPPSHDTIIPQKGDYYDFGVLAPAPPPSYVTDHTYHNYRNQCHFNIIAIILIII